MGDPIGGLIGGLFGSDKVNQRYYNPYVNDALNYLAQSIYGDNRYIGPLLGQYTAANQARIGEVNRLAGLAEKDYNSLYQQAAGANDPLATYERLRTGNLAALQNFSGDLEDRGRRQDSLAAAALGLGGRPDGSYDRALRYDRVSRNIAPYFGSIMSNLGSDTSAIEGNRRAGIGQAADMIKNRTGTAFYSDGMELSPINALMGVRSNQAGLANSLTQSAQGNTAGWQKENNWADRIQSGFGNLWDSAFDGWGKFTSGIANIKGLGGMSSAPTYSDALGDYDVKNGQLSITRTPQQQSQYDKWSNMFQ